MNDENETRSGTVGGMMRDLVVSLVEIVVRDIVKLATAFVFGTVVGAIFCWYFGLPLVYALGGGLIMLIVVLAMLPGSFFSN